MGFYFINHQVAALRNGKRVLEFYNRVVCFIWVLCACTSDGDTGRIGPTIALEFVNGNVHWKMECFIPSVCIP